MRASCPAARTAAYSALMSVRCERSRAAHHGRRTGCAEAVIVADEHACAASEGQQRKAEAREGKRDPHGEVCAAVRD
jgi:hypothetical protein